MSNIGQCDDRQRYITHARSNLESALSSALGDIRATLNQDADFAIQRPAAFRYSDYGLLSFLYPGSLRVKELDAFLFVSHFGRGIRGNYHPDSGRIFLRQGSWCRQCLIHETLHSVSIFAIQQNIRIGNRYLFLREGLTEFLTGYVLWRQYPDCYESWKGKIYPDWCELSQDYEEMARIWLTFCRFIDFEEVKKLYFGNGLRNWSHAWNRFLSTIRNEGYENFGDPMGGDVARLQDRFLNQCKNNFGRAEVERIFEMESLDFEYEKLDS